MWSSVELRQIRTFLTLADELHYGRTAARLGVTPSRVSQSIQSLEALVGGKLFERTSRRVELTPLGAALRDGVAPAYALLESAFGEARERAAGVSGTVRIGMYSRAAGGPHLLDVVRAFQERHPSCRVEFVDTGFARDQLDWMRQGEVDSLVMRLPLTSPEIAVGPVLSREDRVLLVASDHPLATRSHLSYEEVAPYPVTDGPLPREVMDSFVPPVTPSGRPMTREPVHSIEEAIMRVSLGEVVHPTVASLLEHYPHPNVVAVPICDLPPSETALIWLREKASARVLAVAEVAAELLGSDLTLTR